MVLGIISLVIGVILGIRFFAMNPTGAPQQTVQYLGFVCSSIFLVGGFILIQVRNGFENLKIYIQYLQSSVNSQNSKNTVNSNTSPITPTVVNYGDSWVCKKCNERNPNIASSCKSCGNYK